MKHKYNCYIDQYLMLTPALLRPHTLPLDKRGVIRTDCTSCLEVGYTSGLTCYCRATVPADPDPHRPAVVKTVFVDTVLQPLR